MGEATTSRQAPELSCTLSRTSNWATADLLSAAPYLHSVHENLKLTDQSTFESLALLTARDQLSKMRHCTSATINHQSLI